MRYLMIRTLDWTFPLRRTHTGIPLGNGRTGLLVWGEGNILRITIGRAELWDHRGGMPWTDRQNYADIRRALEANDEAAISAIFRPETEGVSGKPARPSVLPLGRLDLLLAPQWRAIRGRLELATGTVSVSFRHGPAERTIEIQLHPERDVAWIRGTDDADEMRPVTSWDIMGGRLESLGFEPPVSLPLAPGAGELGSGGWYWSLPEDPGVFVGWQRSAAAEAARGAHTVLAVAVGRAPDRTSAGAAAEDTFSRMDVRRAEEESLGWWRRYWQRAASVSVPNAVLQEIHDYGLYLFAGLTNPAGVAATLQGPWIEEYDFPPWSSDYHFNVNVQMCYSPAFRAGLFEHLRPLFDLVWSWRKSLRLNAHHFLSIEDGYMLPHAVDDRCTCMGSFWTGTIDHACTAWVAQMMYDYADYAGDREFLEAVAFPFMKGAFVVYRAMMEDDGNRLTLPVSVSPEYRGASMDAWGADASFQLAAAHRLCENLLAAADELRVTPDPAWSDVIERLPRACVGTAPATGAPAARSSGAASAPHSAVERDRILLWDGVDLEESHRHHSHLGGIAPFDTIDPCSEEWHDIVERSLRHWISKGMGLWSGWCMSWASQLHSRVGNGEGAVLLLELWRRVFTNEGRGSMHDAVMSGITLMGAPAIVPGSVDGNRSSSRARSERMQMDGAMGGVAAVQEMLLHTRRGVLSVFPATPASWPRAAFERMRAPGGLIVSGWYDGPEAWQIELEATRRTEVRVAPPSRPYLVATERHDAAVFRRTVEPGERIVIRDGRLPRPAQAGTMDQ